MFASRFEERGYELYIVGGAVRDRLLNKPVTDYDFATDATPDQVISIFKTVIPTGIQHGTVTVRFHGSSFEVTTYRVDSTYSDSRHPDAISFTPSLSEDLKRRDFTINALAVHASTGEMVDQFGGRSDLRAGIIRAIGEPSQRFTEDALRLMRACRFATTLDFSIDSETFDAMRKLSYRIESISAERIRDELSKILTADHPSEGLRIMDSCGLLERILPELTRTKGIGTKGSEGLDTFQHSLLSCEGVSSGSLVLRLAALFHDIGKADTFRSDDSGAISFHGHEQFSAESCRTILTRLKYPNTIRDRVVHLVSHHMFNYEDSWSDAAVRRFIARVGKEYLEDLIRLRIADSYGASGQVPVVSHLQNLEMRIQRVLKDNEATTRSDLAVDGNDIIGLGSCEGRMIGVILDLLLEAVIEDPSMNKRDTLIEHARRLLSDHPAFLP